MEKDPSDVPAPCQASLCGQAAGAVMRLQASYGDGGPAAAIRPRQGAVCAEFVARTKRHN